MHSGSLSRHIWLGGVTLVMLTVSAAPGLLYVIEQQSAWQSWQDQSRKGDSLGETMLISGSVVLTESNASEWMIEGRPGEKARRDAQIYRAVPSQPLPAARRSGLFTTPGWNEQPALSPPVDLPRSLWNDEKPLIQQRAKPQRVYIQSVKRYRTWCVRSCDGYYWPISFAATKDDFARDAAQCTSSCTSPAQLYVHDDADENVDQMVDLTGNKYSEKTTSYAYRTALNASCQCRPEAWEQASVDRHKNYAELATSAQRNGAENRPRKRARVTVRKRPSISVTSARTNRKIDVSSQGLIRVLPRKQSTRARQAGLAELAGIVNFTAAASEVPVPRRRTLRSPVKTYATPNDEPRWMR
jgi:Protein of unknown function (DUF2865)